MSNRIASSQSYGLFLQVAWRNLWRSKRRTLLTVAAIAFGMGLVQFAMSMQSGSYGPMIALGTRMGEGHMQILHEKYHDEPRIEYQIGDISERLAQLDETSDIVAISARAAGFVLLSNDPHSVAALMTGVIPERELLISDLPTKVVTGTYLTGDDQVLLGAAMARNLQVGVGDEVVMIGSNPDGNFAAAVADVIGIFEATVEMERSLVQVSLPTFQSMFEMPDQAHRIVGMVEDPLDLNAGLIALAEVTSVGELVMDWRELMPEISQGIEIDIVSNAVLQFVLILVIVLSIMNTFVMTLFERTRECGMLFAIGMGRGAVYRMTMTETVFLCLVGIVCGGVVTSVFVVPLMYAGIPIPVSEEAIQGQMAFMPNTIYPELSYWVVLIAPASITIGSLIAVSIASIRLFRLNIIAALRTE